MIRFHHSWDSEGNFVGAKLGSSYVDFYFPHGLMVNLDDINACKAAAYSVLATLTLAAPSISLADRYTGGKPKSAEPLHSYIWLIQDYLGNGLYQATSQLLARDQRGKINWKRTFHTQALINDDIPFYLTPVIEKSTREDTIITEIQKYCLGIATHKIGWLYNFNYSTPIEPTNPSRELYYENILLKKLQITYNDHHKLLLQHLLRIVRLSRGQTTTRERTEIGTYDYDHVWEQMIQSVYGNLPLHEYFPTTTWFLNGTERLNKSLRPDTVMKLDNTLYILDAKYYTYGIAPGGSGSLPSSDSIQKQITYGDHAKLYHPEYSQVISAFIVPFTATSDLIEYAGYATSDWRSETSSHQRIHLLLLDTAYLIKQYLASNNSTALRTELINPLKIANFQ